MMDPAVLELLQRFQGGDGVQPLTDEDLVTLRAGLEEEASALYDADQPTPETVQQLTDLAEFCEAVDAETAARVEASAAARAELDAAIGRIRPQVTEPETESDEDGEELAADTTDQPEVADEPQPEVSAEDKQAAAIKRATDMAARRPASAAPRRRQDQPDPRHARAVLQSAGAYVNDGVRLNAGDAIPSDDVLHQIMARRLNGMGPHGGTALIASQFTTYPEDRNLSPDDVASNEAKIRAVSGPTALTASGGICTPVAVDYSIPTFSVADRPVKAALPGFGASRGGIRYLTPPLMSALANSVGIWTHANDTTPSAPATKAKLKIGCASEVEVQVDAVTLRLVFGNFMARFSPEVVGANTELALAQFARKADLNLLTQIVAGSTEVTWAGAGLGAAPELLSVFDVALAGMKDVNRLGDNVKLRTILPIWAKPLLRSDLARRLPGDGTLNVTDAQIMAWFSARNINVSWTLDPLPAQGSGNVYTLQGFTTQTAAALQDYPAKLVFPLYPEGTWQFLDGGQLDLGVVRDSTLDSTNDYETFFETFEGVAKRGIVSYKVIVPLRPTGTTAATKDTTAY